jgi:hypothetical protein
MSVLSGFKDLAGRLPLTAELFWSLRRGRVAYRFNLKGLEQHLPELVRDFQGIPAAKPTGREIFIFISTHYWIEQAVQMGFALAGLGHRVTIGYMPNSFWNKRINRFDLRMQNLYAKSILGRTRPWIETVSLVDLENAKALPRALQQAVDQVTFIDTQYVCQDETVSRDHPVYAMRKEYNDRAARAALAYFKKHRPDTVITPNAMIMEFGAVFEAARHMDIRTVTYEFGDAASHIWIAQDLPVVRHDTDGLWAARRHLPLDAEQKKWLETFFLRRQKPASDDRFVWLSQPADPKGGNQLRASLHLDTRPVVVLATNVLGDSLTLGRQVFSPSMIEWVKRTVAYFVDHPEVQLVIRIHPGETIMVGPTSASEVIRQVLPVCPEHIHVIGARDPVNTYDLMDITDLGLVYVTTAGLEMAARGIPVVVGGKTHYRGRGFTLDPASWEEYFQCLDETLARLPYRLSPQQLELCWNYAYRFFREFPQPYPWHLAKCWQDYRERPLSHVLGEGLPAYEATFRYLVGEPIQWAGVAAADNLFALGEDSGGTLAGDLLRKQQE